jgi:isoprenylcysteine carboxyl methyltransferase (ICMT) family protein YpbQ
MMSVAAFAIDVIVVSLRAKVLLKFKNFWSLEFVVVGSAKYNKESLHKLPFLIK